MNYFPLELERVVYFVKYYGHDFWETYGDHRVSKLPLLGSGPWHVLTLTALYLYFVKSFGPKWMRNRKPFDLRNVMIFHNSLLVFINGGGFSLALWGTRFGAVTLECRPFDPSSPDFTNKILLYLGYTYYITKFIDFLDTIYFVLRKKNTHITGLHVFHHTMMPFWCYIFFKFSTFTNNGFIPLLNAFVHTVMYSYYLLAAFGPRMQPYLWWKKYITQIQMIQFVFCSIHSIYMLLDTSCKCSKLLITFQAFHSLLFLYLFYSFYRNTYKKEAALRAFKDGPRNGIAGGKAQDIINGHVKQSEEIIGKPNGKSL